MAGSQVRTGGWLRTVLLLIALGGLLAFVAAQFTSMQQLAAILERVSLAWLVASILLHVASFSVYAWLYHFGFEAVDASVPTAGLVPVVFAAMFAKAIVPIEGAGFAAVMMASAARRGRSPARAAAATLLVSGVDLATALPLVVAGLAILRARGTLVAFDVAAAGLFTCVVAAFWLALWLGRARPGALRAILVWAGRGIDRAGAAFGRPDLVDDGWAGRNAEQFAAASAAVVSRRRSVLSAAGVSVLLHLLNVAGLFTIFQMLGRPVGLDVLVATFGLSSMLYVISITPQGVGSVEGGTALILEALGMSGPLAIAITLLYRAMNIWVPVAIGFVAAERLALFASGPPSATELRPHPSPPHPSLRPRPTPAVVEVPEDST